MSSTLSAPPPVVAVTFRPITGHHTIRRTLPGRLLDTELIGLLVGDRAARPADAAAIAELEDTLVAYGRVETLQRRPGLPVRLVDPDHPVRLDHLAVAAGERGAHSVPALSFQAQRHARNG